MTDFLLELRSEEIPARMQDKARDDLARLFAAELAKSGLHTDVIVTFATPRRLALIARDLPQATAAVSEETKGPKNSAPPQALDGFLRKTGLTREQLVERDGVFFAVIDKPGRATADVLAEAIPAVIRAFPWPKSMRWGEASLTMESLRWVRPLQGIVALFGEDVVPCEIAGVVAGAATVGHRSHHPGVITIGSASDYVEKLRACHVVVDQDERRQIIALGATMAARKANLELVRDEGLLAENAGLTEWPVPLLGRFDEAFLSVPPEVIQLTARVNQKYFVCRDASGSLANAFVCTANIDAVDGGAKIVEGNQKVLAARLSDAKFFYETDLKVPLAEQAAKLDRIVFHEKLGTVADKVERVAKLARWLVEEGIVKSPSPPVGEGRGPLASASGKGEGDVPSLTPPHPSATASLPPSPTRGEGNLADLAERAARLAKADLVTGMVGEFPELQGLMGGYYAAAQGEDPRVAAAIRDHYKPVGQGDDVPTDPVTVAVSLADKLDTIACFFAIDEKPTGSKDPFALRRAALAAIRLLQANNLRMELMPIIAHAAWRSPFDSLPEPNTAAADAFTQLIRFVRTGSDVAIDMFGQLRTQADAKYSEAFEIRFKRSRDIGFEAVTFFADRLKVQQREAGVRHDLIDAVFALGGEDDLVRLLARVHALQAFVDTEDGANLLAGYKRAANILKKEGFAQPAPLPGREGLGVGRPEATDARSQGEPTPAPSLPGRGDEARYAPEPAEAALLAALDAAEPAAADAVAHEDFEAAMAALATLRAPIDAFFETVIVNDADPAKRDARLKLLARVRTAVHSVADFSKIEG
ncbi:glycine--tRNA ligase subunit beta [Sphingomonas panacis]|uniref:Glycine--tRNA ligase beta subunit n=1 Tax=Sphingomonas panacis TaxID=1560345 RepID=A0A1B3ZC02_9SPHN|nr:glycine--tRNA ligase subunit beta [Sphingomonas panacis]AOH84940.1 glycine--tRNA ligase subunit beta [Sphingomonas panacis]